jgi:sporulation protein YlmC with PRC-barrel domain
MLHDRFGSRRALWGLTLPLKINRFPDGLSRLQGPAGNNGAPGEVTNGRSRRQSAARVATPMPWHCPVFGELQDSLNQIWQVSTKRHPLFVLLKERVISFAMVFVTGFRHEAPSTRPVGSTPHSGGQMRAPMIVHRKRSRGCRDKRANPTRHCPGKPRQTMKLKSIFIISLVVASCGSLAARDAPETHEPQYRPSERFTEFLGLEVRGLQDEKLGKVKFITVDLENARLVEVIVRSGGGFLGIGGRTIAVPPRAVTFDERNQVMRLNATKAKFDAAPRFDTSDFAGSSSRERVAEVNRYFGLEPWFFTEGQVVKKNAQILRLGYVQRSDLILGLPIRNTTGDFIGRVTTLRMDMPKGQVVHVVVATQAAESPLSTIQPRALRFNSARNGLVLDNSLAELADEPHFKWLNASRTSYKEESYVNRDVAEGNDNRLGETGQQRTNRTGAPMEQGQSYRDKQKTRSIQRAIQADSSLSASARNVQVVTLNAQTTLRGHVSRAADRQRIGEIAANAGRPENVSNLVEVR